MLTPFDLAVIRTAEEECVESSVIYDLVTEHPLYFQRDRHTEEELIDMLDDVVKNWHPEWYEDNSTMF